MKHFYYQYLHGIVKQAYRYWMAFAEILGTINAHIIFSLIFITILGPYALLYKTYTSIIQTKNKNGNWQKKEEPDMSIEELQHQF